MSEVSKTRYKNQRQDVHVLKIYSRNTFDEHVMGSYDGNVYGVIREKSNGFQAAVLLLLSLYWAVAVAVGLGGTKKVKRVDLFFLRNSRDCVSIIILVRGSTSAQRSPSIFIRAAPTTFVK